MGIMPAPRIIHEDIQPAVLFSNVIDQRFYRCNLGMVTLDGLRLTSGSVNGVDGVINRRSRQRALGTITTCAPTRNDDMCTSLSKLQSNRFAQTSGSTCYQRNFPC